MEQSKLDAVKSNLSIPIYFNEVIIPQLKDYYSDYTVDFDIKPVCKCPLHDESTPSMRYYEDTNTFFCWGCRAGGDVVALHRAFMQKMNGELPDFDSSIDFLFDYFILGKESRTFNKSGKKSDGTEYMSTKVEIIRYNRFTMELEQKIMVASNLTEIEKFELYEAMDNTHILVSKNRANASECVRYLSSIAGKYKL